jgi:hypothetical protein
MYASEIHVTLPTVNRRTPATVAARLVARTNAALLVLADERGVPAAVIFPPDVLRLLIRPVDGETATVGDLLDDDRSRLGSMLRVEGTIDIRELASRMAVAHAQVAIIDAPGSPRFVLLPNLLDAVLADRDDTGPSD